MTEPRLEPTVPVRPETLARFAGLLERRLGHGRTLRRAWGLERRLRELMQVAGGGAIDPDGFLEHLSLAGSGSPLSRALCDIAPNQETWFFRDAQQLEAAARLAPKLGRGGPLRVLSLGCATGEELYSLAALLFESLHLFGARELDLWGVDVSPGAIEQARSGLYRARSLDRAEDGPAGWRERHLRVAEPQELRAAAGARGPGANEPMLRIRPALRERVRFAVGNLVEPGGLAPLGTFDLVLCRNVLIYFEGPALELAARTLSALVRGGGALVLGRAETGSVAPDGLAVRSIGDGLWAFFAEAAR